MLTENEKKLRSMLHATYNISRCRSLGQAGRSAKHAPVQLHILRPRELRGFFALRVRYCKDQLLHLCAGVVTRSPDYIHRLVTIPRANEEIRLLYATHLG